MSRREPPFDVIASVGGISAYFRGHHPCPARAGFVEIVIAAEHLNWSWCIRDTELDLPVPKADWILFELGECGVRAKIHTLEEGILAILPEQILSALESRIPVYVTETLRPIGTRR